MNMTPDLAKAFNTNNATLPERNQKILASLRSLARYLDEILSRLDNALILQQEGNSSGDEKMSTDLTSLAVNQETVLARIERTVSTCCIALGIEQAKEAQFWYTAERSPFSER